jgi:hypothetical protein
MIVLNLTLMTLVVLGIVSLLAWAIVSDRRSRRAAGGALSPALAPLHRNLVMPRELRAARRSHPTTVRPARTRSSVA